MSTSFKWFAILGCVPFLFGAGCGSPTPQPPAPSSFDVSKVDCPGIPAARQQVDEAYNAAVKAAAQTYADARTAFEADLNSCLADVWKGGPCDNEWKASQQAAAAAQGDISNDDAYHGWKKAKSDWDTCYKNWDAKYKDWSDKGQQREAACRDEFNAKNEAAQTAYTDAIRAAASKHDADNAALDALEKACNEKTKTQTGGVTTGGGTTGGGTTPPPPQPPTGGTPTPKTWPPTPQTVHASACQPAIPGENATPRTGRADDFGPKDIAIGLITTVAEDVTGSPIPTGVLDNQIFAGMVCVKIRTRIQEMTIDESDAQLSGDRKTEIMLRQKIARYTSAMNVWCKIAEGRPALKDVKTQVAQINAMPSGFCKSDADCAAPLCCSGNTIAASHCASNGSCVSQVNDCGGEEVCMGPDPAQPMFDHCGPNHDGNWGYGQSKPSGSPANRPAPGAQR
jgi:hypothetical protein